MRFIRRCSAVLSIAAVGLLALAPVAYASHQPIRTSESLGVLQQRTAASAPQGVIASPGNEQITVTWTAPVDSAGVTFYEITAVPQLAACATASDPQLCRRVVNRGPVTFYAKPASQIFVMRNLLNELEYSLTLSALSSFGTGEPSTSIAVTPLKPSDVGAAIPDAPTGISAKALDQRVLLSWQPPVADGGLPVTSYQVYANNEPVCTVPASALTCDVSEVANGVAYSLMVTATNAMGEGPTSEPVDAMPGRVPDKPLNITASPRKNSASISWDASLDDGGWPVSGYLAFAMPGGQSCTTDGVATSCAIEGLDSKTPYVFKVWAINALGHSLVARTKPIHVYGDPGIVRHLSGTSTPQAITLRFRAPAYTGGRAISFYAIRCTSPWGSVGVKAVALTHTFVGLHRRTSYSCAVAAHTSVGTGPVATVRVRTK